MESQVKGLLFLEVLWFLHLGMSLNIHPVEVLLFFFLYSWFNVANIDDFY